MFLLIQKWSSIKGPWRIAHIQVSQALANSTDGRGEISSIESRWISSPSPGIILRYHAFQLHYTSDLD